MFALRHSLPLVALAGCTELVVLGEECHGDAPCLVEVDGQVPPMDAGFDARVPDLDARRTPDAHPDDGTADSDVPAPDDAAVWMPPGLQNASFELTGGQPGDVAAFSLPTNTEIAPWFSCQAFGGGPGALTGVRAETGVTLTSDQVLDLVLPQDGLTFIAMQYFVALFPPQLVQRLAEPLHAGSRYGFAIYVRSSNPSASLSLRVYGANGACTDPSEMTPLVETAPIVEPGWQRVCVRFTPDVDYPFFMLVENAPGGFSGDRLFLDDVRSVEVCP